MDRVKSKITGEIKISSQRYNDIIEAVKTIADFGRNITSALTAQGITSFLEISLGGAVNLKASDIHIETQKEEVIIRIRIDGILQEVVSISFEEYQLVLSRVKLLAGIKLNIADKSQDGRFSVLIEETPVEIRVSVIPSEYGESIVLRILNPTGLKEIEQIGLRKDLLEMFKEEVKKPNGMIVVTGPTGSGKTSTLYAFLKRVQSPEIKIITIEDPIEYHLKGISQTQIAPERGYDFANGLRSIMRQDPDVILVGEIRDLETAKIALQAALTGHLVFTTIHANDAAGTITRFTDLGARAISIAPAVNMVIAQRLVRKVCKKCGKLVAPKDKELREIERELKGISKKIEIPNFKGLKILKAHGCVLCNNTGYQGRTGIFESFLIDDDVQQLILSSPSTVDLKQLVTKKGMLSMRQDGFIKVLEGITSIEEVERVTKK
ncbi:MAG: type II/IV secretion system protein [Methanosarcinales archaeon]|nr:type II/IV secretion system protein [Methanosarcinales archaeon]